MTAARSLIIIGGGPAGMTAAIEAVRAGLHPTILDEAPQLGGQVYRRPPSTFLVDEPHKLGDDYRRGERLRTEFSEIADHVEILSNTTVLGVWPNGDVLWAREHLSGLLQAERLIIAGGAYDRPVPFPGWTLPGVMTAGGVQTLLKTMRIRPGRRALVVGSGLLIFTVARRMHEIGVEVAAVLDAGEPPWISGEFPREWHRWDFVKDARDHLARLRDADIPLLTSQTVFEAHGSVELQAATLGAVDSITWQPRKDCGRTIEVDLIVTGFGFVPNTQLTELAGCRHDFVPELGGWVPVRDGLLQTTVPGIFSVGDGAGIVGAAAAVEEGRVAGATAAEQLGTISSEQATRRRAEPLERLTALAEIRTRLNAVSQIRPGLLDLATPETLACRCEEVGFSDVRAALETGARDLQAVKLLTRLGMGPCQGRNCEPSTGMHLCKATGRTADQVGRINARPPLKPVTFGALAAMEGVAETPAVDPLDAVGGGAQ